MKKLIVLAGSRREFEEFLGESGLTDSEAIYGYEPERIMGIEASAVKIIGTFWDRPGNPGKLLDLAESRVKTDLLPSQKES